MLWGLLRFKVQPNPLKCTLVIFYALTPSKELVSKYIHEKLFCKFTSIGHKTPKIVFDN